MTLSIIFSAASLVFCAFSFLYFRACLKKDTRARGLPADYQDEMNKLIADIDAATERDAYLIEERIKTLKSLMEEIDKKIGVYTREFDRRRNSEAVYTALGRTVPAAAPPPKTEPSGQSGQPLPVPSQSPAAAAVPRDTAPKPKPLREQIAELAAQGLSPGVISARLKVSISEVDLALAIQNKTAT